MQFLEEKRKKLGAQAARMVGSPTGSPTNGQNAFDVSSPAIAAAAAKGGVIGEVKLTVVRSSMNEPLGMTIDSGKCIINDVSKDTPAAAAGFKTGMQIVEVNGTRTSTLDDIKAVLGKATHPDVSMIVFDCRVPDCGGVLTNVPEEEFEQLNKDFVALRTTARDLTQREAKASRFAVQLKKTASQAQSAMESAQQDVKRIKNLISKSSVAKEALDADNRLEELKTTIVADVERYKQTEAAIKISMRKLVAENRQLTTKLGLPPEHDNDDGDGDDVLLGADSGSHIELAVQLQQLTERRSELKQQLDDVEQEAHSANVALESLQDEVAENDKSIKALNRTHANLIDENAELLEERKRLSAQVKLGNDAYNETVKQLMDKVKSVSSDKDRHIAQAEEMLIRVHGEESSTAKKIREIEKEIETHMKINECLTKSNAGMREMDEKLRGRVEKAEVAVTKLRDSRRRWIAAEREILEISDKQQVVTKQLKSTFHEIESFTQDTRRLANLTKERSQVLADELDKSKTLTIELTELRAELKELEPIEEEVAQYKQKAEAIQNSLADSNQTSNQLMKELIDKESQNQQEEKACDAIQVEVVGLQAEIKHAKDEVEARLIEIEQVKEYQEIEVSDLHCDTEIIKRKAVAKKCDLHNQLDIAIAKTEEICESLLTLESRFGASTELEPNADASFNSVDVTQSSDKPRFLELTEENIRLTDLLQKLQEKTWAAEECRRSLEAEVSRRNRDITRKQTHISKLFNIHSEHVDMQVIIEDTMLSNVKLRDVNTKLSKELMNLKSQREISMSPDAN